MIGDAFDVFAVRTALQKEAEALRAPLEARIREKLLGQALQSRSGALAASIETSVENDDSVVSLSALSAGVPYAAIQEFGGKTAAHEILPVKSMALAFYAGSGQVFARSVRHPGSTIPKRSFLGASLLELRAEIELGLKEAVRAALE